ncbi:MAG: DNA cytosine methyltransferase [Solirubrobacterales bacterium]
MSQYNRGTAAPWYQGRDLTEEQRAIFRATSQRSYRAKVKALAGQGSASLHPINTPSFNPADLMPKVDRHDLAALSLFSGGGGLDLGFDRAGFGHVASYDTLDAAGETLILNRPDWTVESGASGDVQSVDWRQHRGAADVLHGGPPCQPFSIAGRQKGARDGRNLLPDFVRSVLAVRPQAFVAENVAALAGPKFQSYLRRSFYGPLAKTYHVATFQMLAHDFGVPQRRRRILFVGFRRKRDYVRFEPPSPSHHAPGEPIDGLAATLGVRAALGLPDIGYDALAPTIRSTLTGPRHTTSILSSASAQRAWAKLGIWPNGVAADRAAASAFPAKNGDFRLSVADCALLQGFPEDWRFAGATYMALGQIGNSVAPPVAYSVALAVAEALHGRSWSPSR